MITAPRVFWPALGILVAFVAFALIFPTAMGDTFSAISDAVVGDLGWYYILIVSGFIAFSIWVAVAPMGRVVLGKDNEKPEFGLVPWFAMLFAAGMGIGLVFWGVAEPLSHFASPPPGTGESAAERARAATDVTYLHWGLHAWGIYVVVGLAMAYAIHRKGRPVSIRWALEPLLGDRVKGVLGDVIDVIAVVGTLFGVATSLGFGVSQVAAGLDFMGVVDGAGTGLLVALVIGITAIATISVVTGLDKGIKILSNVNMGLAGGLLLFVLLLGPTVFLLGDFVSSVGSYVSNFFRLSFQTLAFEGEDGTSWVSGWTTFYWGWWMSWAPFVGVFIARISRGRTVREFVAGVLLVPTVVTFLWFAVMGGSGIHREIFGEGGIIAEDGTVSTDAALFQLLDGLPLSGLLSVVALVLIVVFFVTSSDSGSFVVDMLSSGGDPHPPVWSRVMWAVLEGAVAIALLLAGGGGLDALQTAAILLALPFSFVIIGMVVATTRALLRENGRMDRAERGLLADEIAGQIARRSDFRDAVQTPPDEKVPESALDRAGHDRRTPEGAAPPAATRDAPEKP
ncbi:BCCT family transporter [Phycicoccus sp. BSK3Z-2]|uniref:BCCT family transporter n=1 Tax=Phycicoccus avicenniae TaxID=2828860 RepID=A0A941D6A1_9MICO|nr:BCCT family transporter [Phycicoccus avicenniae]MBR7742660.1 BCCT family transporter [Phycicoccus avicenniae]